MDTTLCNEQMPNADVASAIIAKSDDGCGVKLRPTESCQYLKTIDGGVGFGPLDICCVPTGEFSLSESTVLQCRDGQTTRANLQPALQNYLQVSDILPLNSYPYQGETQSGDYVPIVRQGKGALADVPFSPFAAVTLDIDFTDPNQPNWRIINQRRVFGIRANNDGDKLLLSVDFYVDEIPTENFILLPLAHHAVIQTDSEAHPSDVYRASFSILKANLPQSRNVFRFWVMLFRVQ